MRGEKEANISDKDLRKSLRERRKVLELMVNIQFQRLHVIVIQLCATELNRGREEKKERENREDRKDRYVGRLCRLSEIKEGRPARVLDDRKDASFRRLFLLEGHRTQNIEQLFWSTDAKYR